MTALLRGRDVSGMPVVDVSTGEDIAEVRDVIFEPDRGVVSGFTLGARGFFGRRMRNVLPVEPVRSVGTHAVMVDSGGRHHRPGRGTTGGRQGRSQGRCHRQHGDHRVRARSSARSRTS